MKLSKKQKVAILYWYRRRRKKMKNPRAYWIHPIHELRHTMGEQLKVEEMYANYPDKFLQYTRLLPAQFDTILNLIGPSISKQDTNFRCSIPARHRLFVTLR
jgi:hypothetical protein